ncbi:MAG TPA: alkaline phosphatase family protein [Solirubrobacterales bacterium]|nr:alkaline phosphatase family protein [Solirubrobacterales bacterium]
MINWLLTRLRAAMAAAATLTGKRFGLLVASSVVATSAIVAAAATSQPEASPLASILGHSLAADRTPAPAPVEAEPEEEVAPEPVHAAPEPVSEPEETFVPEEETFVPEETAPEPAPEPEPEPEEEPKEEPAKSKPEAGRIKHVFVVSLQSSGYQAAFGKGSQMPYLDGTLVKKGLLLTNYSVLTEAATPNGIAMVSGQPPNKATKGDCPVFTGFPSSSVADKAGIVPGEGCVYPVETETVATQLATSGFTWKAYMEGMKSPTTGEPESCVYPTGEEEEIVETGGYSARLNPFTHFHSLLDVGECSEEDVPITELKKDLKSAAKTPSYSYISPDLCSAGYAGQCPEGAPSGDAAADAWLEEVVPQILESPAYKADGLLIIAFGGVNPTAEGAQPEPKPLKTGAVLVSQFISPGSTDAAPYDPYALLRTTEELFGQEPLAKAAAKKTKTLAPALLATETGGD